MIAIPGTSPYEDSYVIKFPDGDVSLERNILAIPSDHLIHSVLEGETIQSIAFRYYGDSGMWGVIADANDILNPFEDVHADMELIIPNYGGQ